jgi:hypothetical protein
VITAVQATVVDPDKNDKQRRVVLHLLSPGPGGVAHMSRFVATAAVLASALGLAAPAAPSPVAEPQPLYYPTTVGTGWTYSDNGVEHHWAVTKVVEQEGTKVVTVKDVANPTEQSVEEVVEVSEKGLLLRQARSVRFQPPCCLLKLPCKMGDRWPLGKPNSWVVTAFPRDEVKVPAGRYTAIRIAYQDVSWWFAPGVGTVKVTYTDKDRRAHDRVLKSFTPGKG